MALREYLRCEKHMFSTHIVSIFLYLYVHSIPELISAWQPPAPRLRGVCNRELTKPKQNIYAMF